MGSIPGQGTKMLHAVQGGKKKKKNPFFLKNKWDGKATQSLPLAGNYCSLERPVRRWSYQSPGAELTRGTWHHKGVIAIDENIALS